MGTKVPLKVALDAAFGELGFAMSALGTARRILSPGPKLGLLV